jgi:hypothetical protein
MPSDLPGLILTYMNPANLTEVERYPRPILVIADEGRRLCAHA